MPIGRTERQILTARLGCSRGDDSGWRKVGLNLFSLASTPLATIGVHKHLQRLQRVWTQHPIYFVTTCTYQRRAILACEEVAKILVCEWSSARKRHGWAIGRYVIMPDHVHFFCAPEFDAKTLPIFVGFWKEWTSKAIKRELRQASPVWQEEFFDHVLRSSESYSEKWNYVRDNPVRHGFVANADDWPWQGQIEELRL